MIEEKTIRSALFRSTSAITALLFFTPISSLLISNANAACSLSAGTYTCAGSDTTTQVLNGAPLNVQLANGYSNTITSGTTATGINLNLTAINGLSLQALGSATLSSTKATSVSVATSGIGIVDVNLGNAVVNGYVSGVKITDKGTDSITMTSTGTITGQTNSAIAITKSADTVTASTPTDVTVSVANVSSSTSAINVQSSGSGKITITTNGNIQGGTSGISATALATTTGLNITTNSTVTGGSDIAISGDARGTGNVNITTENTVTSTSNIGIEARASGNVQDINITTQGKTVGSTKGIQAIHNGIGNLNITATDTITSQSLHGIYASLATTANNASITTNSVNSGYTGIYINNAGRGTTDITTNGRIYGGTKYGIQAITTSSSAKDISITTNDTVTGVMDGINTTHAGTGNITIQTNSDVTGGQMGINAQNSSAGSGIAITTKNVTGSQTGIYANNTGTGTTTITANGKIQGGESHGIYAITGASSSGLAITANDAVISTSADGINATVNGAGNADIVTNGTVQGGAAGINVANNGSGDTTIKTAGAVQGGTAESIKVITTATSKAVTITTGAAVTGKTDGINLNHSGSSTATITSAGSVTGQTGTGISANLNSSDSADLLVTTSGTVTGKTTGILLNSIGKGSITLNANNTVTGQTGTGIAATDTTATGKINISVAQSAAVSGNTSGISIAAGNTSQLINQGTIGGSTTDSNGNAITTAIGVTYYNAPTTSTNPTATSQNTLSNTGTISGSNYAIQGGAGQEYVTHETGTLQGTVDLGDNNDSFTSHSGTIASSIFMGAGADTLNLASTVDLSTVAQLDGGADGDTLNLSNSSLKGFTAPSNDSTGDDVTKGKNLTGWENINLTNNATLKLKGDLFTAEDTGTLSLTNSTLDGRGNSPGIFSIFGDLINTGTIALNDGAGDDVTTVTGNYTGNNGALRLDTYLGGDPSPTDKLAILGNADGKTGIYISPTGGGGALTNHGIELVSVGQQSTSDAFYLAAPVERGAFVYGLTYYGGADQSWYLTSQLDSSGHYQIGGMGALYESGSATALDTLSAANPTLQQRVGQRQWLLQGAKTDTHPVQGVWLRAIGTYSKITPRNSDAGVHYNNNNGGMQIGVDSRAFKLGSSHLVLGVTGRYIDGHARVHNSAGSGKIKARSFGTGATATWYGNQGLYLDSQFMVDRVRQKFESDDFGTMKKHVYRTSFFLSQEAGLRYHMTETSALVPQVQFTYGRLDGKTIHDRFDSNVHFKRATSSIGRAGLAYEIEAAPTTSTPAMGDYKKGYVIANFIHDFSRHTAVDINDVGLKERNQRSWGEVGLGGSLGWNENKSFYSEVNYRTKLNGKKASEGFKGTLGFSMKW